MPVEALRRLMESPLVKRDENANLSQRKKPKHQKKGGEKEKGKIDIRV